MSRKMVYHLRMMTLPAIPLFLPEVSSLPAFRSENPGVVRALFLLMDAAWRGPVPCSVDSDVDSVASICGLPPDVVTQNWSDLFFGWELRDDGRLWHVRLSTVAAKIRERYAAQIAEIEAAQVLMSQSVHLDCGADVLQPELFGVAPDQVSSSTGGNGLLGAGVQGARKSAKGSSGKISYPEFFRPDEASKNAMLRAGFVSEEEQSWLLEKFDNFWSVFRAQVRELAGHVQEFHDEQYHAQ